MTKIESFQYKNGFQMIHQKSTQQLPLCSFYIFCNVGSSNETDALRGIAHFLEHMIFQSSQNNDNTQALYEQYDKMGTQMNAITTKRYTCYYVTCPEEYAESVLALFSIMLNDSKFPQERVTDEFYVIKEENARLLEDHVLQAQELFESKLYKHSSFEEPIDHIRFQEKQKSMDYDELVRWYNWFYVPSNMTISIVSQKSIQHWKRVLHDKTKFTTKNTHHNNNKQNRPLYALDKPIQSFPYTSTVEYVVSQDKSSTHTQCIVGFRTVNHYSDKKHIFDLLTHVLNGMSARLFRILRQKHQLVYSVQSVTEHSEFVGYFSIQTECSNRYLLYNQKREKRGVLYHILTIFRQLALEGISAKELSIGKDRMKSSIQIEAENLGTICKHNGEMHLIHVQANAANSSHNQKPAIVSYLDMYNQYYESITIEQINYAIREYFQKDRMVVSIVSKDPPNVNHLRKTCNRYFASNRTRKNKNL